MEYAANTYNTEKDEGNEIYSKYSRLSNSSTGCSKHNMNVPGCPDCSL